MSEQPPPDPYAVPPAGAPEPRPPTPLPPAAGQPGSGYPPPPPPGYPAPTYPAAGYPGGQAPRTGHGGLAIVALVVAILAACIFWIPVIGVGANLISLVLGIIAWAVAQRRRRPIALGVAATIIGVVGVIISLAVTIWFFRAIVDDVRDAERYCQQVSNTQAQYDSCVEDRASNNFLDRFGIEPTPTPIP